MWKMMRSKGSTYFKIRLTEADRLYIMGIVAGLGCAFYESRFKDRDEGFNMDKIKQGIDRYLIKAMSSMALGLFSSLIIGLILSQLAKLELFGFLEPFAQVADASSPVIGSAIGVAIAYGLQVKPLVMFSMCIAGAFGYTSGGPVGAYLAAVVGSEVGSLVAGKTSVDIIVTPIVSIVFGCLAGQLMGPAVSALMTALGEIINQATAMSPIPMGILVSVVVGMVLTAPISSAALCIMLGLDGLAAGAAVVGCSTQMIGFAVMSYKENGWGGVISVGIGTSMLQFANIIRHPQIWLAPTMASAILGPISTAVLKMSNNAVGAGMGTSGLVGQFSALSMMGSDVVVWLQILLMQFILPALLTYGIHRLTIRLGWVKPEYLKLESL